MGLVLVTGVAGFVGSHLAERLVARGDRVRGVDCFTDYYARATKEANLEKLRGSDAFDFVEADLAKVDLEPLFEGIDSVCHLAAQAGVRASWGAEFGVYVDCNVVTTQRLLETAKSLELSKFVYASSSSVYGETEDLPMRETGATRPLSPYGVTKLAAENLAVLYNRSYGVPTVSLRYFTVYGPRQRPDMAFHRVITAALEGSPVEIYGDGSQTRDFTYVSDIVDGTAAALTNGTPGDVLNLGGGSRVTLNEALDMIEQRLGVTLDRRYGDAARGDMRDTLADNTRARDTLGFSPSVDLADGLARQCDWMISIKAGDTA